MADKVNLGPIAFDASSCASLENALSQIQSITEILPVPDPGPGPDGGTQGVPVDVPYKALICLTTNYTNGVAVGEFVDEYFQAIPGLPTIDVSDPTRLRYATGTITVASGVVTLTGGTFPDWMADGTIYVKGETYTVNTRDSDTQVTLDDTSLTIATSEYYVAREETGQLEGTGSGNCGHINVKKVTSDTGSGTEIVYQPTEDVTQTNQITIGESYTATAPITISASNEIGLNYGGVLVLSSDQLLVNYSTGITASGSALVVDYGDGLTTSGNSLVVNEGDGLEIVSGALAVNEGDGLTFEGGALKVDAGCGLGFVSGQLHVDQTELAGAGLVTDTSSTTCGLKVNPSQPLHLSGDFLAIAYDDVSIGVNVSDELEVKGTEISIVSEITSLAISGGSLTLTYKTRDVTVLGPGSESTSTKTVTVSQC